ncbi:MAG: hypothetical protein OHK006_24380 [Thermodesulfovibrionales bacterium]
MQRFIISPILFLLIYCLAAYAAPPVVGTFTVVAGKVDVFKPGSERAKPTKENDPVSVGDTIRTKSKSFAQITFTDNSTVRIAQNSKLQITEYMAGGKKGENKLRLARGKINAMVSTVARSLTIETSAGQVTTGGDHAGPGAEGSMTVASASVYGASGSPGGPPPEGSGSSGTGSEGSSEGSGVIGLSGGGLPGGSGVGGGFGGAGGGRGTENPEGSAGTGSPGFAGGGGAGPRGYENPDDSSSGGSLPSGGSSGMEPGGGSTGPVLAGGGAGPRGLEAGTDIASHIMVTFENNVMQAAMLGGQGRLVAPTGQTFTLGAGNVGTLSANLVTVAPVAGFQQAGVTSGVRTTSLSSPTVGSSAPETTAAPSTGIATTVLSPTLSIAGTGISPTTVVSPALSATFSPTQTTTLLPTLTTVNTFNTLSLQSGITSTQITRTNLFRTQQNISGGLLIQRNISGGFILR